MISAYLAIVGFSQAVSPLEPHSWRNVQIVAGGFVTGVITHPKAKDLVYCRTDIGGAYRLDPKTRTWIPLQDFLTRSQWNWYGVESIALDPNDPKKIYMAVGTYTNSWGGNGAIFRSNDQGRSWKITPLPFKNGGNMDGRSIGERLFVAPGDGRQIYFGTRTEGLWRSEDAGASWAPVPGLEQYKGKNGGGIGWVVYSPSSRPESMPRLTVGTTDPETPLLVSRDFGREWKPLTGGPKMIPHQARADESGNLYITYSNALGPNGVTDGAVWKVSSTDKWTDITPIKPGPEKTFGYAGISLDPKNPGTLIVSTLCRWGQDTIFRSRDGGETWVSMAEKSSRDTSSAPYLKWGRDSADFGHWIGDCEIDPFNPDRIWYVTGATIYETKEATKADKGEPTRWFNSGVGIEETAVLAMVSPPEGIHLMSGLGDIGGFPHPDLDKPYEKGMLTKPLFTTVTSLDFAENSPKTFIRVGRTYGEKPRGSYSTDGGFTWDYFATEPPGSQNGGGHAAISSDGKSVIWTAENTPAHVTFDWGKTWEICAGLPAASIPISDRVVPSTFYAQDSKGLKLYISQDKGRTFTQIGSMPSGEPGSARAVFGKAGHLWLPNREGLYFTADGGARFKQASGVTSAESVSFGKAAPGADYPSIFVIGRVGGVEGAFRSIDRGLTWVQINNEKSGFGTMMHICGDPKVFGRVYIGTNGRGIIVFDPIKKQGKGR